MAVSPVAVTLDIKGFKLVSDTLYTNEYTVVGKTEQEFNLAVTDGYQSVGLGKIGDKSVIIAESSSANLRITTASGVITLPVAGKLFWDIPVAWSDTITNIDVSTESASAVSVMISIWGL